MDIFTLIAAISVGVLIGFTLGATRLTLKWRASRKGVPDEGDSSRVLRDFRLECSMIPYMLRADLEDLKTKAKGLHHGLSSDELNRIIAQVDQQITVIDDHEAAEAERRAAIEPALADLVALRTVDLGDPDEARKVFERLHEVMMSEGP